MASFSQGAGVGFNIGAGIQDRIDARKQQIIDNDFRRRQFDLIEEEAQRKQTVFDAQRDRAQIESDYTELDRQYVTDAKDKGQGTAALNYALNSGSIDKALEGGVGAEVITQVIASSPEINDAVTNGDFKPSRLVPVKGPDGEKVYVMELMDSQGKRVPLDKKRSTGGQDLFTFSEDDVTNLFGQGLHAMGALKDPENVRKVEENGFNVAEVMQELTGQDFSKTIPRAAKLGEFSGVLSRANAEKRLSGSESNKKVFDATDIKLPSTSSRPEQIIGSGFGGDDIPDDAAFRARSRFGEEAGFGGDDIPDDAALPQRTAPVSGFDSVIDSVSEFARKDLAQADRILGNVGDAFSDPEFKQRVDKKGFVPAIGEDIGNTIFDVKQGNIPEIKEAQEYATKALDVAKKVSDVGTVVGVGTGVAKFLGKHLFGITGEDAEVVTKGLDPKDKTVTQGQAEATINKNISTQTAPQRVKTGSESIKEMSKHISTERTKSRTPTPKQKAVAATMRANGILGETAYNTYLQTGKFSFADVEAAALENNSRATLIRAQNAAQKYAGNNLKEAKAAYEDMRNTHAQLVADKMQQLPYFNPQSKSTGKGGLTTNYTRASMLSSANAMLDVVSQDIGVLKSFGLNHPYQLKTEHLSNIADYVTKEGLSKFRNSVKGGYIFGDDVDASTPQSKELVDGYLRQVKKK